jgi:hypothetical protein
MHRTAVFVDAGYVFAQGSVLLIGTKQGREFFSLNIPGMVSALNQIVSDRTGVPLLRIYWYDAMRVGRPSPEQMVLADTQDIKIRLGQVNSAGEQKGVDALIITDLAELARNQAISDAVLVSGDEDLRVGVVLAQQFGVRVHLIGIHPGRGNQSRSLLQEADTATEWDLATIRTFLNYSPPVIAPTAGATSSPATSLDNQIEPLVAALAPADLSALKVQFSQGNQMLPKEHDTALLRIGRIYYSQATLSSTERAALRTAFVRLALAR